MSEQTQGNKSLFNMVVAIVLTVLLVGVLVVPIINTATQTTTTTYIDIEGAGWLKLGYNSGKDFDFEITNENSNISIGDQTGLMGDNIFYADSKNVIFADSGKNAIFLIDTESSSVHKFSGTVSVENTGGTLSISDGTETIVSSSSPTWAYVPDANGEYGFFANGGLNLEEDKPKVAVGSYAGVYAYNNTVVAPNDLGSLGLTMSGDYATGDVTWEVGTEETLPTDSQPSMAVMSSGYAEIPVMGANPSGTQVGDLYYTFSGHKATVVGHSSSIDWASFTSIPDKVTSGGKTYAITSIGSNAFRNCTNLALTSLPSGLTSISSSAFSGCTNLALTSLPSGITFIGTYAFGGCTNLALTSLPSGITSIKEGAFGGCTNLALTSLPDGVTSIDNSAFGGCTNLALTSLPSGITSIGSNAFESCTNLALTSLPDGVTSIGNLTFIGCTNLALTSLPDGVTSIGDYAFRNCTNLALTSLPSGITSIGEYAFQNCTNLALTELPTGVTSIGSSAFQGCTSLTTLSILGSPTIGNNAFQDCTNLKTIYNYGTTPITTTSYGLNADSVLNMVGGLEYTFDSTTSTATVTGYAPSIDWTTFTSIPNTVIYGGTTYTVTGIGTEAFKNCTNLALTSLPSGLTSIEQSAFQGCTNLKTMIILSSPTIQNNAFQNTGIKEILNLGETEITTTSYGLNADSVRSDIPAIGYIAPVSIPTTIMEPDGSITSTLMQFFPVMLVLVLIVLVGTAIMIPKAGLGRYIDR